MDATNMQFSSLLAQITKDFPQYHLNNGKLYHWSPTTQSITYDPTQPNCAQLLHELAHAELAHITYSLDIDLVRLESQAWHYAQNQLSPHYLVPISDELIQDHLDSYRNWLHQRSQCPHCKHTGLQTQKNTYSCLNCRYSWGVNNAKQCRLQRTTLQH